MNLLWWLVLGADAVLIAALTVLLWRWGKAGSPADRGGSPAELERFLGEAGRLGKEFDRLLAEKRELIGTTLRALDQRLARLEEQAAQADEAARRLEDALAAVRAAEAHPAPAPPVEPAQVPAFRQQVAQLARQGRSAAQIAQATGRPIGEVELVLSLGGGA